MVPLLSTPAGGPCPACLQPVQLPRHGSCPSCGSRLAVGYGGRPIVLEGDGVRAAGTAVVIADAPGGLEVLMVRRASRMVFHGGAWVFPGGAVDEADSARGHEADGTSGHAADGATDELAAAETEARVATVRELAEEGGVTLPAEDLVLLSHWTTPRGRVRRFSTWFFLATVPPGTSVMPDGTEVVEARWSRPATVLQQHAAGELQLVPPTFLTLTELASWGSAAAAERAVRARTTPVFAVRPLALPGSGEPAGRLGDGVVVLPDDAAFWSGDLDTPGPRHRIVMDGLPWQLVDTRATRS